MMYYGFGNYYLSSIQQGIQNFHVATKISVKYDLESSQNIQYRDWATNHHTVCCLNGGNSNDLQNLIDFFNNEKNPYAWDFFREDDQSLCGALTAVGIILPEKIYNTAKTIRERTAKIVELMPNELALIENAQSGIGDIVVNILDFSQWELQLLQRLPSYQLAK